MNFLSSALNLISINSIPYTTKEKIVDSSSITYPANESIWSVYNGVNPKNDTEVSIFEFSLKSSESQRFAGLARNCFKKLKVIKFPSIINIVDFIENESSLYIVTERVTPLATYLSQNGTKVSLDAKLYGIYSVANAIAFINSKANCLLGRLDCASSVFVNSQGDWKLFGFELLTNLSSDPDQPIYRLSASCPGFGENLPPEFSTNGTEAIRKAPFLYDSYKLGAFIVSIIVTEDFSLPPKSISPAGSRPVIPDRQKIPKRILTSIQRLLAPPNERVTTEKFLIDSEIVFSTNRLIQLSQLLDDIKYKDQNSKLAFFKHDINDYINGDLPPGFLEHKVLPEIINQYNFVSKQKPAVGSSPEDIQAKQETTSLLLTLILKLSIALSPDEFSKTCKPIIFQAFTLSDRSIRLNLLKYLPEYSNFLTDLDVQNKIFSNLLTGLQDTNFMIREITLTSITNIIDKVSVKQVNQELLKVLAKSQLDPKPSIRTNTLILIINISSKIYSNSRNSVVITALAKSLRDTFTPCKLAALAGFEKLIDTFSLDEICSKILGNLAVSLMDSKSYKVRQESKRVFDLYLTSVEKHAATLPCLEEDEDAEEKEFYNKEMDVPINRQAGESEGTGAFGFGWNVVNKFVSSEKLPIEGKLNNALDRSTPDLTRVSTPKTGISQTPAWNEEFEVEDDWVSNDDKDLVHDNASPVPKLHRFGLTASKPVTRPNLMNKSEKVSSKPKESNSALKLDMNVADDEDNWDEEW